MLKVFRLSNCCFFAAGVLFFLLSKIIFDHVHITSKNVVDEEFHLPLGYSYCKFEFNRWDDKVTTLPGLYIISALFLGSFELCTVYYLRAVSFGASLLNILLFTTLLNASNNDSRWKNMFSAFNIALLPPLFFLSHLYYTDVVSVTSVLLILNAFKRGNHFFVSIFGVLSVLMRQTNIIYVGMVFALLILKEISKHIPKKFQTLDCYKMNYEGFKMFVMKFTEGFILTIRTANLEFILNCFAYITVLLSFLLFVIWNGSIVVGDKKAHKATIHIPQLFYFSLFSLFFGWPYYLKEMKIFLKHVTTHKLLALVCCLMFAVIVYFNTQVHPYLLADNRHYIFYIWNRFYGKYVLFKYLIIPVYMFSLYVIISKLCYSTNIIPTLIYIACVLIVLVPQKLIEVRYFFIPYIYFRVNIKNVSTSQLALELIFYFVINVITFYLFFTKEIIWDNFEEPQRLLW